MTHGTGFTQESRKSWPWCITFALQQGAGRRRVSRSQVVMTSTSGLQHLTLYVSYGSTCITQTPSRTVLQRLIRRIFGQELSYLHGSSIIFQLHLSRFWLPGPPRTIGKPGKRSGSAAQNSSKCQKRFDWNHALRSCKICSRCVQKEGQRLSGYRYQMVSFTYICTIASFSIRKCWVLQQLELLIWSFSIKVNVTNPLGQHLETYHGNDQCFFFSLEVLDIGGEPGWLAAALLTRGTRDRHKS